MEIINNIQQKSDEWLELRKGKMTASHAQEIGNCGKGLDTYILEIMAEYYSTAPKEQINNIHIERGNELEDSARAVYEFEHGCIVEEVAFIQHSDFVGCSPDGLIGEDGGLEIKCPSDTNYLKILLDDKNIDSKYIWQIQMNLFITGRQWWDYMAYNPNFSQSFYIKRIYPDLNKFENLQKGFEAGIEKILGIKSRVEALNVKQCKIVG